MANPTGRSKSGRRPPAELHRRSQTAKANLLANRQPCPVKPPATTAVDVTRPRKIATDPFTLLAFIVLNLGAIPGITT